MPPTIEEVIAAIPDWAGRTVPAERIPAGLTNTNYRVEVDGTPYFVRIPGAATELLAVDRGKNELHNTRAAAAAGVAPRVLHALPAWDVFVLEWLPARTMSVEALGAPGMPGRIAEVLRRLHAGPRFRDDFDMFRLSERYLALVDERGSRSRPGYREHLDQLPRIEAALAAHPLATVPCHNDLLADNYLDDGERLWLVDWEYSGNNDPTFELGNTCQELGYGEEPGGRAVRRLLRRGLPCPARPDAPPDDHVRRRLDALGGHPGAHLDHRLRLHRLGRGTLGAGAAALDGPEFEGWLGARGRRHRAVPRRPDRRGRSAVGHGGAPRTASRDRTGHASRRPTGPAVGQSSRDDPRGDRSAHPGVGATVAEHRSPAPWSRPDLAGGPRPNADAP